MRRTNNIFVIGFTSCFSRGTIVVGIALGNDSWRNFWKVCLGTR